ncbi:hypothetical protein [Streptomyces buecherae]|uniref:hypothetical protein n=1 Tax=Streptomyces buecherae TaxID=2763006 RepID=UPI00365A26B4
MSHSRMLCVSLLFGAALTVGTATSAVADNHTEGATAISSDHTPDSTTVTPLDHTPDGALR